MIAKYKLFLVAYEKGLADIDSATRSIWSGQQSRDAVVRPVVVAAINALKATPFGADLYRDATLEIQLSESQDRLTFLAERLEAEDPHFPPRVIDWVTDFDARLQREYIYYGEMGKILHYYRDRGSYLGLDDFQGKRKRILEEGRDVGVAIDTLLDHILSEVLFTPSERQKFSSLAKSIKQVSELPLHSVEKLESLMVRRPEIIQQQFSASVCQLALRLFGHIRRETLDQFLSLKSATAIHFGYEQWRDSNVHRVDKKNKAVTQPTEAAIERKLNRYIEVAYERAILKAKKEHWPTISIIRFTMPEEQKKLLHLNIGPKLRTDYLPMASDNTQYNR